MSAFAALIEEFGATAVSLAVAALGYEAILDDAAESDALADLVRAYLSGDLGV